VVLVAVAAMTGGIAQAVVIEDWQMNEADGTQIPGLANAAGTGAWSGGQDHVATLGGNLRFTQGANTFRNSTLSTQNVSSGLYELRFRYEAATIEGGDATGANCGFGFRDIEGGFDLFLIRLQRQNGELRLQTRIGGNNSNIYDFDATSLPDSLAIRAEVDLDSNLMDLYYEIGTGGETLVEDISIQDGELDGIRMVGTLNDTDFGATDFVDVDYVTLSLIPEPATVTLLSVFGVLLGFVRRRRG
jgi:hypothetical protein